MFKKNLNLRSACMCFRGNTLLFLWLKSLCSPGLSVSPWLPLQQVPQCQNTQWYSLLTMSPFSSSPFSCGTRRREHDRVRLPLQLRDAQRQEDRHGCRNSHPLWLRPLLLVRQEINLFIIMIIIIIIAVRKSKILSCCGRGPKVAPIAVATEAALLWLALGCGGTARDWLQLGRGVWEQNSTLYFSSHVFPIKKTCGASCRLPLRTRESSCRRIWNC